ncbi:MAG: putative ABC transport system permease protein [Marivirga sp.]|jgi:putative ABC transport system permease protein
MFRNYIKIAWRNFWRNKTYSAINIIGFTIGITCSSLLLMLITNELSFDNFYENKERIYRVVEEYNGEDGNRRFGMVPPPLGKSLSENYPEVEQTSRLYQFGGQIVFQKDGEAYQERDYYYAEDNIFDIFKLNWIAGDPNTALERPYSLVIDEDWAMRLFGTTDVLNKTLESGGENSFLITGVVGELPENSHIQYKILVGIPDNEQWFKDFTAGWDNYGAYTYLLLAADADPNSLQQKIPQLVTKNMEVPDKHKFELQALSDIHFHSAGIEFATDGDRGQLTYIYVFTAIAIFMLLIACINYMNLATAKSLSRGKEIGVRKVSGASRQQLIGQFLTESVLFALISLVLSLFLIDLLLPTFNELAGKNFRFSVTTFLNVFGLLSVVSIAVGLLSGSYPAWLMSRLRTASILKGAMQTSAGSVNLRRALVGIQFTLSTVMILATLIAYLQLNYIQDANIGFKNDQMLVVDINNGNVRQRFETMKSEFEKSPYIQQAAVSSRVPGEWKSLKEVYARNNGAEDSIKMNYLGFDEDMIELYEIELIAGQGFSGNTSSDSLHIVLNETAVKTLGLADPIGQLINVGDGTNQLVKIVGVVKDFNFESLHKEVGPIVLGYRSNIFQNIDYFSLKFDPKHTEEVLTHAKSVHKQFDNFSSMEYHFLEEQWASFYEDDRRLGNIFAIGGGVTILIACLGLFGLSSFIIQQRKKEIGMRKVLGASTISIVAMLSKDIIKLMIIALCIATPIAWYAMNQWLGDFAYKIDISWWMFASVGLAVIGIAFFTVSYQSVKAALMNPVESLKSE